MHYGVNGIINSTQILWLMSEWWKCVQFIYSRLSLIRTSKFESFYNFYTTKILSIIRISLWKKVPFVFELERVKCIWKFTAVIISKIRRKIVPNIKEYKKTLIASDFLMEYAKITYFVTTEQVRWISYFTTHKWIYFIFLGGLQESREPIWLILTLR